MEIKLSKNSEGVFLLELSGDLDLYGSNQLKEFVMKMIKTSIERFIISLNDIKSINSAGIGSLIYVFSTLRKLDCTLIILVPEGPVLEALEMSRIRSYFTIASSLKEALVITGRTASKKKS